MSILAKMRKLSGVVANPDIITCNTKYLFILSHMRSRSSVLSHILGSNDGVCGYSEQHRSYVRHFDLIKMRLTLYDELKCSLKDKYLMDKILHNNLTISKELLKVSNPKVVFLLRDAENTIKSIINRGFTTGKEWYKSPEKVFEYYCSRLSCLEEYAEIIGGGYFFLESDDLVDNTDHVLESLTQWLGLDIPLDQSYSVFQNTGRAGYGDPSDNIKSGKVKKTKGYPDIKIPLEILQKAESSYQKCKASLMRRIID